MLPKAPFILTAAAKARISSAVAECLETKGKRTIPALVWIDGAANANRFPSHIGIGLYDVRAHIEDALYDVDGMELGVAMSDEDFSRIEGRTIDFKKETGLNLI